MSSNPNEDDFTRTCKHGKLTACTDRNRNKDKDIVKRDSPDHDDGSRKRVHQERRGNYSKWLRKPPKSNERGCYSSWLRQPALSSDAIKLARTSAWRAENADKNVLQTRTMINVPGGDSENESSDIPDHDHVEVEHEPDNDINVIVNHENDDAGKHGDKAQTTMLSDEQEIQNSCVSREDVLVVPDQPDWINNDDDLTSRQDNSETNVCPTQISAGAAEYLNTDNVADELLTYPGPGTCAPTDEVESIICDEFESVADGSMTMSNDGKHKFHKRNIKMCVKNVSVCDNFHKVHFSLKIQKM